jgi:predicted esterase
MPPGRQAIRTDSMRHWFTWPTSAHAQRQVEHDVLAQWLEARLALERRFGRPFERTYVVGFSNGAYYVSSLALRGRLPVDGYAAFAGGVAPGPIRPSAYAEVPRVPFYVGYGMADDPARRDGATLAPLFRALGWPGKVVGSRGVGHEVTDAQWKAAIGYFRAERPLEERARPSSAPPTTRPPSG